MSALAEWAARPTRAAPITPPPPPAPVLLRNCATCGTCYEASPPTALYCGVACRDDAAAARRAERRRAKTGTGTGGLHGCADCPNPTAAEQRLAATSTEWMQLAACRHMPAELFFPEEGGRISGGAGKAVCNTCPTRILCLEYAVTTGQHVGIWGMTSEAERLTMRRRTWPSRRGPV